MVIMKISANPAIQRLTWSSIAIIILLALVAAGCGTAGNGVGKGGPPGKLGRGGRGGRGGPGALAEVPIQTTTIQRISIQREVDLAGSLISPDQAKVSSEV